MLPRITRAVAGFAMTMVVVAPASTRADDGAGVPALDEATFLQRVRERSPRRAVFDERRHAADAAVAAAAVLPNPLVFYEREDVASIENSQDVLRLGWQLDLAGRRGLARNAARAGAIAERASVDRDVLLLELEARTAYLDAVYARARVAQLEAARTELATVATALAERARQGDASSYDAERATLELEVLDDERADARRQLEVARLRLGALIGEPARGFDASGSLVLPVRPAGPSALQRPDVDAARARAVQATREATLAGRTWIPKLELVVGVMAQAQQGSSGVGYVVGVGGDLPIFDRGAAAAAKHRAEAKRWEAEARSLATEATGEAAQAREVLVQRIAHAEGYASGPAARALDLARRVTLAYREGDRPILELIDVHRTLRQTAVRALELVYEARRAELALARAQGRMP